MGESINMMPFIDLKAQKAKLQPQLNEAVLRVIEQGQYIMGPEIDLLEKALSEFAQVPFAISCANGTDALGLALMAKKVGSRDAILVPSFTFAATAEVVAWFGATPIFIDSQADTFNICPISLEAGIETAKKLGLNPVGIIAVDLFGQPADYEKIQEIAEDHHLWIIADAAQSFGATYYGKRVGSITEISTTSFFPAKPLGCYGDGGAIFTTDPELARVIKSLRIHGQGEDKYDNVRIGMNGRLDTIQAAILLEKLKIFPKEIELRQQVADRYDHLLSQTLITPTVLPGATSVWAQYTIRLPEKISRKQVIADLKEKGIPSVVYYPKPLHQQTAYKHYPVAEGDHLPVCEQLAKEVLSLPMSPYVTEEQAQQIVEALIISLRGQFVTRIAF